MRTRDTSPGNAQCEVGCTPWTHAADHAVHGVWTTERADRDPFAPRLWPRFDKGSAFRVFRGALESASKSTTAVLLAAGEGTRLHPFTLDRPKCLVEVAGRPLLDRTLTVLEAIGITELVLVTGYREDVLHGFLERRASRVRVRCIRNEVYASTNNAYSLWTAREAVTGGFVLLDGDLLFEPDVLRKVLETEGDAVLAVERRSELGEEEMKVLLGPDVTVAAVNKTMDPREAIGESVGIARFSAGAAAALWDRLGQQIVAGQRNVYYELAFEALIAEGMPFHIGDVTGLLCMEIDTPDDLATAQQLAHRIDARALQSAL
jgi:choline kinase